MVLAIDIGNTNVVIGCFCEDDDKIKFVERISTNEAQTELEYVVSMLAITELYGINPKEISGAIISSVVPNVTSTVKGAVRKITGINAMVVGPGLKTGLSILIDNPAELGSDLVCGAVAGINEYSLPLILIDMGTATTISVVDENKNYLGGMIMPGIKISVNSLTSQTAQLPHISLNKPKKLIGTNTTDSMRSGILYGAASQLDGMIKRINADRKIRHTVVATGGLASYVIPLCDEKIIIDDEIMLKGLIVLYHKNKF